MRETMPEQDITLGEVYRAVLSIREDLQQTRTEIQSSHHNLSAEQQQQALAMREHEVTLRHLTDRIVVLETVKLNSVETRVQSLEASPKSSPDNLGRAMALIGGAILAGLQWWFSRP
jgi:hypothetical protein